MSLGPSSTRKGTPRISQSLNFQPGLEPSRSSSVTRMFAFASSSFTLRAVPRTAAFSSSFLKMGTMTTWYGASFGGRTSPWSSPCTMMMAPITRVDRPHDVVQQCCNWPFWSRYLTSKACAKFCPRKCEVPDCSAFPSPIMASIEYVTSAPANFSASDFFPGNDVVALVHQHGEGAVRVNPLRPHVADDRFRSGTNHQRLGQLLSAANGDDGQLRRKPFHVVLLFIDETAGNEQRKRHVLVPRSLEAAVQRLLNVLPQCPAVRAHDHAAAHGRVIGKLRLQNELVVPFGEICGARR